MYFEERAYVRSRVLVAELTGSIHDCRAARSRELLFDVVPVCLNVLPRWIAGFGMAQEIADVVGGILIANGTRGPKLNRFWQTFRILKMGKRSHVPPPQNLIGGSI